MKRKRMRQVFTFGVLTIGHPVAACPLCNSQIKKAVYNSTFYPNLFTMLSAFLVLGGVVALLAWFNGKRHQRQLSGNPSRLSPVPLATASIVLGIGIGGFIDGIVLHQILQWHEMLSAKIPPTDYVNKSVNMFWDGIFHLFTLVVTFVGIVLLWKLSHRKDVNRSGYLLSGGLLTGWGLFNLIEGVIDHQVLKLHNVREVTANPQSYNLMFLGLSLVLLAVGSGLMRRGSRHPSTVAEA